MPIDPARRRAPATNDTSPRIESTLLRLLAERAVGATICPSDVARALAPDDEGAWRALMPDVRRIAGRLSREGRVAVTRRGVAVDAEAPGGPIRIGLVDASSG